MAKKKSSFSNSVGDAMAKGLWFYLGWKLASADAEEYQAFFDIFGKHVDKYELNKEDITSIKEDFLKNDIMISTLGIERLFEEFKKIDGI